ncbi:hypothetical protein Ahy_B10g105191 [Arachis hypogaea]|uniref:Aminotransferase-like plant mobile domain-containing protein n=1 Tax=Arachis hypogaea TaxID=3818 RepID=A0A444X7V5_ARAHY|nr:hypothetical protein Ahy_B10g105191 [Arachis hypogaea]
MPFGECTITLQNVAYQLGLPVDGLPVSGCLTDFEKFMEEGRPAWEWFEELFGELPPQNKVKQYTVHFTWFHERFRVLPDDATEETLFGDKSRNRVYIRWFPFVARLDDMGSYSWGSAALAWLYRCMCRVANRNATCSYCSHGFSSGFLASGRGVSTHIPSHWHLGIHICIVMLETVGHISAFIRPQGGESHPVSPSVGPIRRSRYCLGALCFARRDGCCSSIDSHRGAQSVDRVLPQLGGVRHEPESVSNIDWLHAKDVRSGDRWFASYYQVRCCPEYPRVPNPGPSADFLPWWYRVALRFLSPDSLIVDPRAEEISQDVVQRGSSQAPPRVPMPNMPNNKRVERRRRVGTRATDQEWRWLDDMIQDDRSGGDRVGHADHRVRGGRPQRRGGSSGGTSAGPGDRPAEHATAET